MDAGPIVEVDAGLGCAAGETECDGACVDTASDGAHCGACGVTCGAGEVCAAGVCAIQCPSGQMECGGGCFDVDSSSAHCGACDAACAAGEVCSGGACAVACPAGQTECTGGCFDVTSARTHCGACGTACGDGEVCSESACVSSCGAGLTDCSGSCRDIATDRANCGACGTTCGAGEVCNVGACEVSCGAGLSDCSGSCRDLTGDNANCGACGTACGAGEVCSAGACVVSCGAGLSDCSGSCRDLGTDRANCGGCGTMCAAGEVCSGAACAVSCGAGLTDCGGSCRDLTGDGTNCGACGTTCGAGEVCSAGACTVSCGTGLTDCSGSCRDTASDRAHCGACGTTCAAGEICTAGACVLTCAAGLTDCAGTCTDTDFDPSNCGACGTACAAGEACVSATCRVIAPPESCDGIDNDTDGSIDEGCPVSVGLGAGTVGTEYGGATGTAFADVCPAGQVATGMYGWHGCWSDAMGITCGTPTLAVDTSTMPYTYSVTVAPGADLPLNGGAGGAAYRRDCPADMVLTGFAGDAGTNVDYYTPTCSRIDITGSAPGGYAVSVTGMMSLAAVGTPCGGGGAAFDSQCPADAAVNADHGTSGVFLNSIGLDCVDIEIDFTPRCNTDPARVLIYGPGGTGSQAHFPAGSVVTVASDAVWRGMTTADFGAFDVIWVDGNNCGSPTSIFQTLLDTQGVWGPAVTGRMTMNSADPDLHAPSSGTIPFIQNNVSWLAEGGATDEGGATGMYFSWGCSLVFGGPTVLPGDFIPTFGAPLSEGTTLSSEGTITATGATHPILAGLTSADLSWGQYAHGEFATIPAGADDLVQGSAGVTNTFAIDNFVCVP